GLAPTEVDANPAVLIGGQRKRARLSPVVSGHHRRPREFVRRGRRRHLVIEPFERRGCVSFQGRKRRQTALGPTLRAPRRELRETSFTKQRTEKRGKAE